MGPEVTSYSHRWPWVFCSNQFPATLFDLSNLSSSLQIVTWIFSLTAQVFNTYTQIYTHIHTNTYVAVSNCIVMRVMQKTHLPIFKASRG